MNLTEKKVRSNAERFISAYNIIDHTLRVKHNIRRSLSFSDMVRKTVVVDYIVRKYEDKLIDYGRLRNAIIHKSNEKFIIAEPHTKVTEEFEQIAKIISAQPSVYDTVCTKAVLTVEHSANLKKVIELIYASTFSNIPVYKNGGLIGVANGQKIIDFIGRKLSEDKNVDINKFLEITTIEDYVKQLSKYDLSTEYFEVCDINLTVEKALNMFYNNRKLLIIILTKGGHLEEMPIGIVTPTDIMDLNEILI